MAQNLEKRNTVSARAQVIQRVSFEGKEGGSPRIMFVGNSITRHEPAPQIGWNYNHGMAASSVERDYVHTVIRGVQKTCPDAAFCIVQASIWETKYTSCDYDEYFTEAKDFYPDIIITAIGANIKAEEFRHGDFVREMGLLHDYLSGGKTPILIQSGSFFNNPKKTEAIKDYISLRGTEFVDISDIAEDERNLALGLYEHKGVQMHPGDRGMALIAERFLAVLNKYL